MKLRKVVIVESRPWRVSPKDLRRLRSVAWANMQLPDGPRGKAGMRVARKFAEMADPFSVLTLLDYIAELEKTAD